jgi:F0F1-type ATP synthase assembly protein I
MNQNAENEREKFQKSFYETFGLYVGVGMQIVAATVLGTWAGKYLDEKLATQPFFLLGGLILGCVAGFYSMYRVMQFYQNKKKDGQ